MLDTLNGAYGNFEIFYTAILIYIYIYNIYSICIAIDVYLKTSILNPEP